MGRPRGSFSRPMREAVRLVRRFPKISPKELARILARSGYKVSPAYSRKLKQRAREFPSRSGISVTPIPVTAPEAKTQTPKIGEKKLKPRPVSDITFTQPKAKQSDSVTENTTGLQGHIEAYRVLQPHGFKFGVLLPAKFYEWCRSDWNLHRFMARLRYLKNHGKPRVLGNYYGVNYACFPPGKKHGLDVCHLIWSVPRPSTVKEYHAALGKMQAFVGEWGFEFDHKDVWFIQHGHYAEAGNRFGFPEPVEIRFPDGGFIRFDKSLGIPETEYDSLDTFMAVTAYRVGVDEVRRLREEFAKHMGALSSRLETLEKIVVDGKNVRRMNPGKEPVYKKSQAPWLRQPSEQRSEEEYKPSEPGYHGCVEGLAKPVPECMVKECHFKCRLLWREG